MGPENGGATRDQDSRRLTGPVELRLLDGFDLRAGGSAVPLPAPAQRLIAVLAVHLRSLSRPYVAGLLWPTATKERSMTSLRSALRQCAPGLVLRSRTHVRLGEHILVDYHFSLTAAHSALAGELGPDAVSAALDLLAGDLLPDLSDEWLEPFRLHRHQLRLSALEALCDRLLSEGRPGLAVQAAMTAVAAEPLRETAQRRLIRALVAEGNRAQALRHYRDFCQVLRAELGIAPSFRLDNT